MPKSQFVDPVEMMMDVNSKSGKKGSYKNAAYAAAKF